MKFFLFSFIAAASITLSLRAEFNTPFPKPKIKVLVITGGHEFQHKAFYNVFNAISSVTYDTMVQPQANAFIASPEVNKYDALIFYDMVDSLLPSQQQTYISLLKKGKSMIFLHHSLVSYQYWPEFIKIVGGQYHTRPVVVNGKTLSANYEHDVSMAIKVEDKQHPITQGIHDFEILDEAYGDVEILAGVKPLLSTTHPKSMRYVAWINHYGNSDVVYIQLGHGPSAYSNPNFQKLIQQAIEWSAAHHSRYDQ
jgi:type 1 glutamine amidotransferase